MLNYKKIIKNAYKASINNVPLMQRYLNIYNIYKSNEKILANHAITFGLQGAGNVVFQKIILELLPHSSIHRRAAIQNSIKINLFRRLGEKIQGNTRVEIGYSTPGFLNGYIARNDSGKIEEEEFICFPAIPSPTPLVDRILGLHAPPSQNIIDLYLKNHGFPFIFIRHPIDVMMSYATKISPTNADREKYRNDNLSNSLFVSKFAWAIENFWKKLSTINEDVLIFRYEDLIYRPENTIAMIAKSVGHKNLNRIDMERLKTIVNGKEFFSNHKHNIKSRDWLKHIPANNFEYFESIRPIAEKYGYEWPKSNWKEPEISVDFHVAGYNFFDEEMYNWLHTSKKIKYINKIPVILEKKDEKLFKEAQEDTEFLKTMRYFSTLKY